LIYLTQYVYKIEPYVHTSQKIFGLLVC
jgi:hypothetical protein